MISSEEKFRPRHIQKIFFKLRTKNSFVSIISNKILTCIKFQKLCRKLLCSKSLPIAKYFLTVEEQPEDSSEQKKASIVLFSIYILSYYCLSSQLLILNKVMENHQSLNLRILIYIYIYRIPII